MVDFNMIFILIVTECIVKTLLFSILYCGFWDGKKVNND